MTSFFQSQGEAQIHFGSSDFTIMKTGSYVICATTGEQIPLDRLRYWNEERQEAYIDAAASLAAWQKANA
ncbi:DUF2093 domain-containing protein [Litorimonas sp. RW-G-Af-16]|uniref:DUF2093 domain-containing protein n=1 Tax=Litorimonas sp. RW-G-Af-16 TaxID=3241168 RepID=UPI00390C7A27